ncbi:unnamed protein product [Lathyrus sativus]|nr:unnamed protein product [Lathyrus sativus]
MVRNKFWFSLRPRSRLWKPSCASMPLHYPARYLFIHIVLTLIKLVSGNSAGTVTAYYVSQYCQKMVVSLVRNGNWENWKHIDSSSLLGITTAKDGGLIVCDMLPW